MFLFGQLTTKSLLMFVSGLGIGGVVTALINYWTNKKQFLFEKLHSKRLKVIRKLYKMIVETEVAFQALLSAVEPAKEADTEQGQKEAAEIANELDHYFRKNRIYFKQDLAADIDLFITGLRKIWRSFSYDVRSRSSADKIKEWNRIWNQHLQYHIPLLKGKIECRFRHIIGIEHSICWWRTLKTKIRYWFQKRKSRSKHYPPDST